MFVGAQVTVWGARVNVKLTSVLPSPKPPPAAAVALTMQVPAFEKVRTDVEAFT